MNVYSTADFIRDQIEVRRHNLKLVKSIEEFLGDIPAPFSLGVYACLARQVATPNREFFYFKKCAKQLKLSPVILEYTADKYTNRNTYKFGLTNLSCAYGSPSNNRTFKRLTIVNSSEIEGKKLCDLRTLWGQPLVDFHHSLFVSAHEVVGFMDMSSWVSNHSNSAKIYMEKFLTFFICHSVLVENFTYPPNNFEQVFFDTIVVPAYSKVSNRFGLEPLIMKLEPSKEETETTWASYSRQILANV